MDIEAKIDKLLSTDEKIERYLNKAELLIHNHNNLENSTNNSIKELTETIKELEKELRQKADTNDVKKIAKTDITFNNFFKFIKEHPLLCFLIVCSYILTFKEIRDYILNFIFKG